MIKIWNWLKNNPARAMFLVPILLVAGISISHVVRWYDLANPISWAIYLSIAIEVAAMSAIVASSAKVKGFSVWFVFIIVTLIQFIGNIFFSYTEIDVTSKNFQDWSELSAPIFELIGGDVSNITSQKRWLALLEGGLLPLISLTSLHFFIKHGEIDNNEEPDISKDDFDPTSSEETLDDNIELEEPVQTDGNVQETSASPTQIVQAKSKGHEIIKARPQMSEKMRKITQKQ